MLRARPRSAVAPGPRGGRAVATRLVERQQTPDVTGLQVVHEQGPTCRGVSARRRVVRPTGLSPRSAAASRSAGTCGTRSPTTPPSRTPSSPTSSWSPRTRARSSRTRTPDTLAQNCKSRPLFPEATRLPVQPASRTGSATLELRSNQRQLAHAGVEIRRRSLRLLKKSVQEPMLSCRRHGLPAWADYLVEVLAA